MSDIVQQLRAHRASDYACQDCYGWVMDEAADRIEELMKVLEQIATTYDDSWRQGSQERRIGDLSRSALSLDKSGGAT